MLGLGLGPAGFSRYGKLPTELPNLQGRGRVTPKTMTVKSYSNIYANNFIWLGANVIPSASVLHEARKCLWSYGGGNSCFKFVSVSFVTSIFLDIVINESIRIQ